jgi:hypothetical protein
MNLEELLPTPQTFKIKAFDVEFKLRPCTLGEYILMGETFSMSVIELLNDLNLETLCKIILFLLDEESKKTFKAVEVNTIDCLTGAEVKTTLGGYRLLLKNVANVTEQKYLMDKVLLCMGHKATSDIPAVATKKK